MTVDAPPLHAPASRGLGGVNGPGLSLSFNLLMSGLALRGGVSP